MFDSLLNSKFYNKCKHSVKCTRTRLDLLRRKRRAMLKFLKKDVTDLVVNGLESHAFGRMEGLIFEMNQASCYDTIELYCEFIVKQLNNLQKERECPQEALEAVSTLIFAAARFHDLPELCDLRHTFTEKYGSSVESFVNREFVQKLQNKSFTNEEKLQVMKSVAEEFSVPFDSKALEWKITCAPGHKHDLEKKGSHKRVDAEASVQNGQKIDRHSMHERKYKATPEDYEQKQEMKVKPKDIHVDIGQMGEKTRKNHSEKPGERSRPMDNCVSPLDVKRKNTRKEVNKLDKKNDHHERELMNNAELDLNCIKKRELGAVKPTAGPDRSWGHADLGLKTLGQEKHGDGSTGTTSNRKTANIKAPSPYSKPYRSGDDEKFSEENTNSLFDRPKHVGGFGQLLVQDKQHAVAERTVVNMRPPYVKAPEHEKHINQAAVNGYNHTDDVEIGKYVRGEKACDYKLHPVSVRTKNAKPPSTHADDACDNRTTTNDEKMMDRTPYDRRRRRSSSTKKKDDPYADCYDQKCGRRVLPLEQGIGSSTDDINNARAFHRIPSERRRHNRSRRNGSSSASGSDYNGTIIEDHESEEDEADTAIDFGNLLPRASGPRSSWQRKHRSRSADPGRDDEEERVMDKLLMHYSKKGREEHDGKRVKQQSRIPPRPRADHHPAHDGVREHSNNSAGVRAHRRPDRAASLPPEPAEATTKPNKAPVIRSVSMQPAARGNNVHPKLPDFDELAERIRALKNDA